MDGGLLEQDYLLVEGVERLHEVKRKQMELWVKRGGGVGVMFFTN